MKSFTTTRFRCDHCAKTMASRTRMRRHEATCGRDPAQRSCLTCAHHGADQDGEWCDELGKVPEGINNSPLPRNCPCWRQAEASHA